MKQLASLWVDTKREVIVFSEGSNHTTKNIYANIESRERIPSETKWFSKFDNQFVNFEKQKEEGTT